MKLSIIVAANLKGVIGKENALIWRLPNDLKRFKKLTMGKPILMGRKTFESIGKPLPGRTSIVITRDTDYAVEGVVVAHSLPEAIDIARETGAGEAFVIGGGQIYQQALALADRIYLTRVHEESAGDTFFNIDPHENWQMVSSKFHKRDDKHRCDYEFIDLERKAGITS